MRVIIKLSTLSLFALAILVIGVNAGYRTSAPAPEVEAGQASRALYRVHCAECHGTDGRSNTKRGRETEASDLTSDDVKRDSMEKVVRIITNGKGDMPGFKRKLSTAQIASVARYIKTL